MRRGQLWCRADLHDPPNLIARSNYDERTCLTPAPCGQSEGQAEEASAPRRSPSAPLPSTRPVENWITVSTFNLHACIRTLYSCERRTVRLLVCE